MDRTLIWNVGYILYHWPLNNFERGERFWLRSRPASDRQVHYLLTEEGAQKGVLKHVRSMDVAKSRWRRLCRRLKEYSLGRQLVEKVLFYVFWTFPLLAWAAWQLQYSLTAWGTLRKHVMKHFGTSGRPTWYVQGGPSVCSLRWRANFWEFILSTFSKKTYFKLGLCFCLDMALGCVNPIS